MAVPPDVALILTRKKAQYGRFGDCKQWEGWSKIALPETEYKFLDVNGAPVKVGKTDLVFLSTKAFLAFLPKLLENLQSLHNFGPGDLELIAPGEVKAIWAMEDQLLLNWTGGLVELRGGGFYHETWVERDGDWFLKSLELRRTYTKLSILARVLFLIMGLLGLSVV